jgi:RHS repeat-associated protein
MRPTSCGLGIFYIHTDQLNTPRIITRRSTADVVWRWDTGPFGETTPNQNPAGLGTFVFNLRFAGQYYDAESGLNYNRFRDYDAAVGRYVEADPVGLFGGTYATYVYAIGNPIENIDPRGLGGVEEDELPETDPVAELQYESLLSQIRGYEPDFEDPAMQAPNAPRTWDDVLRLKQELQELKWEGECRAPGAPREFRRKPGSLGTFKGTDALRAENRMARDAATAAGLNQDQARELHDALANQEGPLSYGTILEIAYAIKNGAH